ncbi:MAG: hypothetical protein ACRDRO_06720, partial [Pseudonocardiaceae bacterium]
PGVPRDAHPGEERHFLATQTSGPLPYPRGQRQLAAIDLLAMSFEKAGKFSASFRLCTQYASS